MSFTDIADERRLTSARAQLGALPWDVEPDAYQRLRAPSDAPLEPLLRLLARRGLDPALATPLLNGFACPLERALIAHDMLTASLLGRDDDALAHRLATELAPLARLGNIGPIAVPRDRVAALIDAARSSAGSLADVRPMSSLAAIAADDLRGDADVVHREAIAHAKRLALAHLPSLALAFAQVLWHRFALTDALDVLIETASDHGLLDAVPVMPEQDDLSLQRRSYFAVRTCLLDLDVGGAAHWLEALGKHPAAATFSDPRLLVARADFALWDDGPFEAATLTAIEQLVPASSLWRYGCRVRDATTMQVTPEDAPRVVDQFITPTFGNDGRLWALASNHRSAPLLALLARELRYCAHDPEVWRGLSTFLDDGDDLAMAIESRLHAQLEHAVVTREHSLA